MNLTPFQCVSGLGIFLSAYFVLLLFSDLNTQYAAWGLYGEKTPLAYAGYMLGAVAKTQIRYYLYGPLLTLLPVIALYYIIHTKFPISWILAIILFQLHLWAYQAIPPAVLLLGNSRPETIDLRERLERGLHPYRIIVLLDSSVINPETHSRFQRNLLEWDNFRTTLEHDWRSFIRPLINISPLIVIDTRVPSPCVVEEIRYTLETNLAQKTIFLTQGDGTAPALDAAGGIPANITPKFAREDQLIPILKGMGLTRAVSPDDLFRPSAS